MNEKQRSELPASEQTIREHFAAMAMQGMLANHEHSGKAEAFARDAVAQADALIAELAK